MGTNRHGTPKIPASGPAEATSLWRKIPDAIKGAARILSIVLLCLVLIVLIAVPIALLVENVFDSAGEQTLVGQSASLGLPRDSYYGTPKNIYLLKKSDLCVTFEFLGLDQVTSSATYATFGILIGVTGPGHKMIGSLDNQKTKRLDHPYQNVSLVIKSQIGLSSIVIPVPVSSLAAAHTSNCGSLKIGGLINNAAFRASQDIFVLGQPRAFPQDWYELDDSVTVLAGRGQNGEVLPSSLAIMSRDQDLSMRVHIDDPTAQASDDNDLLIFNVQRQWLIIAYTYTIGLAPFVLLIGLLLVTYVARKGAEVYEVAIGVAAAILAILPLRSVLVPSSLPGITRLDILFGLVISVLVVLSFVVILRPRTSRRASKNGGGSGAEPDA